MFKEQGQAFPIYASWEIVAYRDGVEVAREEKKNLIVKDGRENILNQNFGFAAGDPVISLAAGACATAATVNDTRLNYEHILGTTRKALLNTSGSPLSDADIADEEYTDGLGNTYYKKIVIKCTYEAGDANNDHPFQEYGMFTVSACPGTPTGTSGIMFNHLVAASPITKDVSTEIVITITLRV